MGNQYKSTVFLHNLHKLAQFAQTRFHTSTTEIAITQVLINTHSFVYRVVCRQDDQLNNIMTSILILEIERTFECGIRLYFFILRYMHIPLFKTNISSLFTKYEFFVSSKSMSVTLIIEGDLVLKNIKIICELIQECKSKLTFFKPN